MSRSRYGIGLLELIAIIIAGVVGYSYHLTLLSVIVMMFILISIEDFGTTEAVRIMGGFERGVGELNPLYRGNWRQFWIVMILIKVLNLIVGIALALLYNYTVGVAMLSLEVGMVVQAVNANYHVLYELVTESHISEVIKAIQR